MKILFVTSECAPYSKSGGLADVAFSLPPALKEAGNEMAIITPYYACAKRKYSSEIKKVLESTVHLQGRVIYCGLFRSVLNGVPIYFVDNEYFFNRDRLYGYDDDKLRFAYFSKAVIELLDKLEFMPQIIHCNDWETAPAILYLKDEQFKKNVPGDIKSVYTIHNIAYQGQFGRKELYETFSLADGWYDGGLGYEFDGRQDINLMKGAMLMADAVSTVSPTYAKELHYPEFGKGLQGVVDLISNKMHGILNGIDMDHYDPMLDKRIAAPFNFNDMSGKAVCKAAIQKKFGIAEEPTWPVLSVVARLVAQKGVDLIMAILPRLMELGFQLIVFGQGEQRYIDFFNYYRSLYPEQLGFSSDYSEDVAAQVFAGSDFYLMPSAFEPCGLSQMMAMRYGTVPIVHETGGLKDSVRPYSEFDHIGDGFSFSNYEAKDLYLAIYEAVRIYFGDKEAFDIIRKRCMNKDFSWLRSALQYNRMYSDVCGGEEDDDKEITFWEAYENLKNLYEVIDVENRKTHPEDYENLNLHVQFSISGAGSGIFHVHFTTMGIEIDPYDYKTADAFVTCSYEYLLAMATGTVSPDKLFMNGQLRIAGNLAKGTRIRTLIALNRSK